MHDVLTCCVGHDIMTIGCGKFNGVLCTNNPGMGPDQLIYGGAKLFICKQDRV